MLIRTDALSRSSGNRRTTVAFGMVRRSAGLEDSAEPYEWKTDIIKTVCNTGYITFK